METPNIITRMTNPTSVATVLQRASTFIANLEDAVKAEEKQVADKRKELAALETKVVDLDESIEHGKVVADRFKDLLKKPTEQK